jgi:hypothetical protein
MFTTICSILLLLEIFYCHLVHFVVIWYIFPRFGILYEEKSGNPAGDLSDFELRIPNPSLPEIWVTR